MGRPRKRKEVEEREEEIRRWGRHDPASRPGRPRVWAPRDTVLNEGNLPIDSPDTDYDVLDDSIQKDIID